MRNAACAQRKFFRIIFSAPSLILLVLLTPCLSPAQLTSNELACANAGLLSPIATDAVPSGCVYLSWQRPWQIILPGNVFRALGIDLTLYDLGSGRILLDDRAIDYDQLQAQTLQNQQLRSMSHFSNEDSQDGSENGGARFLSYSTNDFWLEVSGLRGLTNAAGPIADLTVHHPDQNQVFDLFFTPSLPATNGWYWFARGLPGQTNFSIPNLPRGSGFFVAGTTNGTDAYGLSAAYRYLVGGANTLTNDFDGDNLWDAWEVLNFGDLTQGAGADFDGDQATNLEEFSAGTDPNTVSFRLHFPTSYFGAAAAAGSVEVLHGAPAQMTILVDGTNRTDAAWTAFSPDPVADLGTNEDWHSVWVGLRGRLPSSEQTWQWARLKLDLTPPRLFVKSPASNETSQPLVQVVGYCAEALAALTYGLSNSAGVLTNQLGLITSQSYDTNTWEFTSNHFQCFDVRLANGNNTITLRATDLAGNTSATNLTLNLDFSSKTNPPEVRLYWPQNGATIGASSFTWRGWVDDPTARLTAQVVDATGTTTSFEALVERNQHFWVDNLPLSDGTNTLSLTATDVAGNSAMTNITVVKSGLLLTIDPVAAGQTAITGTISATGYKVWANGVPAAQNGDATWAAEGVPGYNGGTTVIQARAVPMSDNGGNGSGGSGGAASTDEDPGNPSSSQAIDAETFVEASSGVYIQSDHSQRTRSWLQDEPASEVATFRWSDGSCGTESYDYLNVHEKSEWPASWWPQFIPEGTSCNLLSDGWNSEPCGAARTDTEHCDVTVNGPIMDYRRTADTEMTGAAGGRAACGEQCLFVAWGGAAGVADPFSL